MKILFCIPVLCMLFGSGCISFDMNLLVDKTKPLREYTLKGSAAEKIAVIPVEGMISDKDDISLLTEDPGMVELVISQLRLAAEDDQVKAVVLKINSPGGLTTASDIIYNEIMRFKCRTKKKVVVSMMDMATSGGYMVALPADLITAHPTTVTGSVGVIFLRPQLTDLLDKIGVGMDVTKSGKNKDMGSPFRHPTEEENKLFQHIIDQLDTRFVSLVQLHRKLTPENLAIVNTARIFNAEDALKIGLIDKICYLDEAIGDCRKLAGLPGNTRIVVYRRLRYPNDNLYNTSVSHYGGSKLSFVNVDILNMMGASKPGFYAIWPGVLGD